VTAFARIRKWEPGARSTGLLLLVLVILYLVPFVGRGWIPHDEGTIAGDAVRLLDGELPHVQFQDPYTGGMTWLYAGLFRAFGIDLLTIRRALLAAAVASTLAWYDVALRFTNPVTAAAVAFVGLLWSFPNYFAGLPSWWALTFASLGLAAFARYLETRRLPWLFALGLSVGLACAFKQTGLYLVAAAWMALAFDERQERPRADGAIPGPASARLVRVIAIAVVCLGLAFVVGVLPSVGTLMLLVSPIVLFAVYVVVDEWRFGGVTPNGGDGVSTLLTRTLVLGLGVAVPVAIVCLPYLGGHLSEFAYGALILPQKRGTSSAYDLARPIIAIAFVPYLLEVVRLLKGGRLPAGAAAPRWVPWAVAVLLLSLTWTTPGYRFLWNAVRFSLLAIVPFAVVTVSHPSSSRTSRSLVALIVSFAAFMAFFQFPFPAPVYFCYAAPLVILALFAAVSLQPGFRPAAFAPVLLLLAAFAVIWLNRGYAGNIGLHPEIVTFAQPLDSPRGHINVSTEDAETYRRMVALLDAHARGRYVHAFPDCPEVYYLADRRNPTAANFEFFELQDERTLEALWNRHAISAIVMNRRPGFSPPPSPEQWALARRLFPNSEDLGRFEVRWR
jgi:hypothetical protein